MPPVQAYGVFYSNMILIRFQAKLHLSIVYHCINMPDKCVALEEIDRKILKKFLILHVKSFRSFVDLYLDPEIHTEMYKYKITEL